MSVWHLHLSTDGASCLICSVKPVDSSSRLNLIQCNIAAAPDCGGFHEPFVDVLWHVVQSAGACCTYGMLHIWHVAHMACCAYGMWYIWHVVHMACGTYGMLYIWHGVYMACCAYGMLYIWHVVHMAYCTYGTLNILHVVHTACCTVYTKGHQAMHQQALKVKVSKIKSAACRQMLTQASRAA